MPDAAESILQHDNNRTRVTLWKFIPGAATGWHRHEMDYVHRAADIGQAENA